MNLNFIIFIYFIKIKYKITEVYKYIFTNKTYPCQPPLPKLSCCPDQTPRLITTDQSYVFVCFCVLKAFLKKFEIFLFFINFKSF